MRPVWLPCLCLAAAACAPDLRVELASVEPAWSSVEASPEWWALDALVEESDSGLPAEGVEVVAAAAEPSLVEPGSACFERLDCAGATTAMVLTDPRGVARFYVAFDGGGPFTVRVSAAGDSATAVLGE